MLPIRFAALAAFALGLAACSERPNLLLVTLDTTRVDRLGVYGRDPSPSPRLDALAAEATVYERAYSTSSWTLPAHASLFTGKFPSSHGARLDAEGPLSLGDAVAGGPHFEKLRARGLAEAERTLAEELRDAGYTSGAVVAGPWMKRVFGLAQGFDHWDDSVVTRAAGAPATLVSDRALDWLDGPAREPFFLFLNYFDAHAPYRPPPRFAGRSPESAYEGEIAYADEQLGRIFDFLRERGLWERTAIVVTADHGELFGEHGLEGHNRYLYEPLVRVPLVVKPAGPGVARSRTAEPIQLADVRRLVLAALGLEVPAPAPHPIFAEVYPLSVQVHGGQWRALFDGSYKYLWNSRGAHRLHDLAADPDEETNLAAIDSERAAAMQQALERFHSSLPAPPAADAGAVDAGTRRALEALGYLE